MGSKPPILIREFSPADYLIVRDWWEGHGWDAVPLAILPKLGILAHRAETDLAAAWLYMDNSVGVCWLEWVVSNPLNRPKDSLRAINLITDFMKSRARELGYGVMMTTCKQASLAKVQTRNGFVQTDSGMIHLLTILK